MQEIVGKRRNYWQHKGYVTCYAPNKDIKLRSIAGIIISMLPLWKYFLDINLLQTGKHNLCMWKCKKNLNLTIYLMEFLWIIFHFFFNVVHVFSHHTHYSWHYLYSFWSNLQILTECLNNFSLIIYNTMTQRISPYFLKYPLSIMLILTPNQFFALNSSITSFFHFLKVWSETSVYERTEMIFWWKGWWIGSLYSLEGSFLIIPRNESCNLRIDPEMICLNFVLFWIPVLWTKM